MIAMLPMTYKLWYQIWYDITSTV